MSYNYKSTTTSPNGWTALVIIGAAAVYFTIFRFFIPLSFGDNDDSMMMKLASGT